MASTEDFTSKIVSVVVGVIVVGAVAVPVIMGLTKEPESGDPIVDPNSTAGVIIEILPVFLVLAVLMIIVKLFMGKKN